MPDLRLLEGYGVELEYMIVDKHNLQVLPVTDKLLTNIAGALCDNFHNGDISWCNELALHVVEFKTSAPAPFLKDLSGRFHENIKIANKILGPLGGMLLPTAMHPFMDPYKELILWPHGQKEIYNKYNAIFNCQGHGWANLQSVHLNLPFSNDQEFEQLHAAVRLVIPILPAIAASSPMIDGKLTGIKDTRMQMYLQNQSRIPSITGKVIPEQVWTKNNYCRSILERNYSDIAPFDPEGILQEEWLNSRGAIARFSRMSIEIRVMDIQESPMADLAILQVLDQTVQNLIKEKWSSLEAQKKLHEDELLPILLDSIKEGENNVIAHTEYLKVFGVYEKISAGELWAHLVSESSLDVIERKTLDFILREGTLSTRIIRAVDKEPHPKKIREVYSELANALQQNQLFIF